MARIRTTVYYGGSRDADEETFSSMHEAVQAAIAWINRHGCTAKALLVDAHKRERILTDYGWSDTGWMPWSWREQDKE